MVKDFFDKGTWTLTYVVYDPVTLDAVVIDPVWNYDQASSKLTTESVEEVFSYIQKNHLKIHLILETHAHADHISGSQVLKQKIPSAKVGIGSRITEVQKVFKDFFNFDNSFLTDGSQFDILMQEEEPLLAGSLKVETLYTPGHTPACCTYVVGDAVFTGDAIFMPDSGTGRCDFPAGSAAELYNSIHEKIYKLPDHYRVFVGHDYQPNGRDLAFETTIGHEKLKNIQLKAETAKIDFIAFRSARDKTLSAPKLLLPSVQVNIRAGQLAESESNGMSYLKIPIRK